MRRSPWRHSKISPVCVLSDSLMISIFKCNISHKHTHTHAPTNSLARTHSRTLAGELSIPLKRHGDSAGSAALALEMIDTVPLSLSLCVCMDACSYVNILFENFPLFLSQFCEKRDAITRSYVFRRHSSLPSAYIRVTESLTVSIRERERE